MSKHAIPLMLGVADLAAAAVCAYREDWARCWYWLSAASITFSTITMRG